MPRSSPPPSSSSAFFSHPLARIMTRNERSRSPAKRKTENIFQPVPLALFVIRVADGASLPETVMIRNNRVVEKLRSGVSLYFI